MQWIGRRGSSNVDDRRRQGGGGGVSGKGCTLGGGVGVLVIALIVWLMGGDPMQVIGLMGGDSPIPGQTESYTPTAREDSLAQFVSVVLADTEEVWTKIFADMGQTYRAPELVLFTGYTTSACGAAQSATGPFYCPGDEKVYIDLSFFSQMENQLSAGGDFAYAYVIAHEVGHHVQKLLGTLDQVNAQMARVNKTEANRLSVGLELQADFYAGLWANHAQRMFGSLDPDDIQEALNAATAIGDDRLQEQAQGYSVPDSFTHGTSRQRYEWFYKGYTTGDIRKGNTFEAI